MGDHIRRIALLTGGGDAPGLNAVIWAATRAATQLGWEVLGIRDGFEGLLGASPAVLRLDRDEVRGIRSRGGTILGTTNRGNPLAYPTPVAGGGIEKRDRSAEVLRNVEALGIDALVVIGGDGSLSIARELGQRGLRLVGVPKTIDNDLGATAVTFGFDTAVATATDAVERLRSTAESHQRVMVVEVMGRHAGWIALESGVAGGAHVVLIPEIPFEYPHVVRAIERRWARGHRYAIVVAAEGAAPRGSGEINNAPGGRLGGVAEVVGAELQRATGHDVRTLVLGHLQRGGSPTHRDRLLGVQFGVAAIEAVAARAFDCMVGLGAEGVVRVPLADAIASLKRVSPGSDTVRVARAVGITFGDA